MNRTKQLRSKNDSSDAQSNSATFSQQHLDRVEQLGLGPSSALSELSRPCAIGSVERCCLLGKERCDRYAVRTYDPKRFGAVHWATKPLGEGTYGFVLPVGSSHVAKCSKQNHDEYGALHDSDLHEIVLMRNLIHPNVLRVEQVVLNRTRVKPAAPCNTMMVLPRYSMSFGDYLKNNAPINNERQRAWLLYQLLRGVAFIHSRSVWHRDLKPRNVLLDKTNDGVRLAIADFGLSQGVALRGVAHSAHVGTLWWRAPELLLDDDLYTEKVDVWAVGVMWTNLFRSRVFEGDNAWNLLNRIFSFLGRPAVYDWWGPRGHSTTGGAGQRTLSDFARKYNVGPNELNLALELLTVNPAERISARAALDHVFFDPVRDDVERVFPTSTVLPTVAQAQCYDPLVAMELNPVGDYLAGFSEIRPYMHGTLVEWLRDVTQKYSESSVGLSVLATAVDIINRYMLVAREKVSRSTFQRFGISAYIVASKLIEINAFSAKDGEYLTDYSSRTNEIVETERDIVFTLDADLDRPSANTFWEAIWGDLDKQKHRKQFRSAQKQLENYVITYALTTQFRGSQLAYAVAKTNGVASNCLRRYERFYPELFNASVVEKIVATAKLQMVER